MSNQLIVNDARRYDFNTAAWIAQEYALGDGLLLLHNSHPEIVPSPVVVKRWRREFPAFDILMVEAEHARAEVYVDQTLVIADSDARTAGAARNSIQSRQWAAARMMDCRSSSLYTLSDSRFPVPSGDVARSM